jgi:TM2 domain-containing membrane protein YozV
MERKNSFLTFIAALIPGVGYMYLGLIKKGVQTLALFLLVKHFFPLLGIGFLNNIILAPFWFYTFFDTFNIVAKVNRGESVNDSEFVFQGHNGSSFNMGNFSRDQRGFLVLAWMLILIGALALVDRMFEGSGVYYLILSQIKAYFFPLILIAGGIYMIIKEDKNKER